MVAKLPQPSFWPIFPLLWLIGFNGLGWIANDDKPGGRGEEIYFILHAILGSWATWCLTSDPHHPTSSAPRFL